VDEQARRCRYCAAPVATLRCATCFHMNVPEAGYCSGCGQQLGLEPVGAAATLPCPVCKQPLTAFDGSGKDPNGGSLFDCGLCGGQFVEHPLLREMLHHHERAALVPTITTPLSAPLSARAEPRNAYIPCPACASLMNRKNFGGMSGVIVDVCKKHGTWFDLGELPRVLAFVASGGLDRSHQRTADEEQQARRDARAAFHTLSHPVSSHDHAADYTGRATLTELLVDLLVR